MEIRNSITLPIPPKEAWERFIHEGVLQRWLGADRLEIDLFEENTFSMELEMEEETIQIVGETALLVPPEKFGMTWMEQKRGRDLWSAPTRLLFDFEETAEGCRLVLSHEGFDYVGESHEEAALARYREFWKDDERSQALKDMLLA